MALVWKRGLPFAHGGPVLEGLAAARPAAASAPDTIYFATDTGVASYSDGASWTTISYSALSASDVPDVSATYQARSERAAASGYASLDAGTKVPTAQLGGAGADNTKFLRGDQTWQVPSASAGVDSLAKAGSTGLTGNVTLTGGTNVTLTQAGQDISIAAASGGAGIGAKLFDSTLGGDAASIDTGAGGLAAAHDCLDIYILSRTSQAVTISSIILTVNNDTSAIYDNVRTQTANATVSGGNALAQTGWTVNTAGDSAQAGSAGMVHLRVVGYDQATFHKQGILNEGMDDSAAANNVIVQRALRYRSTTAISRLKVAAGSGNLRAGSRLLIYGVT